MEFTQYIRKPFTVEAVEITEENIVAIAKLVGKVQSTNDGTTYIALDRRTVPNVRKAHIGWFMTRLGDNFRCYAPKVFFEQFDEYQDVIQYDFTPQDVGIVEADPAPPEGIERPETQGIDADEVDDIVTVS